MVIVRDKGDLVNNGGTAGVEVSRSAQRRGRDFGDGTH